MPEIQLHSLKSLDDTEHFYRVLNNTEIVNAPLTLECSHLHFVDAQCTLALMTAARLWFRWTGKETRVKGLSTKVHEHLCRLGLFELTGETLIDADPLGYDVPKYFGNVNDRQITPQFVPSHPESNRLVMDDVLDPIESSIAAWFQDPRLQRDVLKILSELGSNIVHSEDYGYIHLQRYGRTQGGSRLVIAVNDLGIGIRQSLARVNRVNPDMPDSDCIEHALQRHVTGTREARGIGLDEVRRIVVENRHFSTLSIRSGRGILSIDSRVSGCIKKRDDLVNIPGVQITLTLEGSTRQNFGNWAQ